MKIGLDAKRALNNTTGLGNYARFVIGMLLKQFPEHSYYLFTDRIRPEFAQLYQAYPNVHIVSSPYRSKLRSSLWRVFSWRSLIQKYALDVFHGLSNELPAGIQHLPLQKIVTIHDLIFLRYPQYYSPIDRWIYTRKTKHALRVADFICATSKQTRHDLIERLQANPDTIKVTYQDCLPQFRIETTEEMRMAVREKYALPDRYYISIGTLENRKDQASIIRAWSRIEQTLSPFPHLVLLGKATAYKHTLDHLIKQRGLSNSIHFISNADAADFPGLIQASQGLIYVSEFEGFGIPILEGLRSSVPVFCTQASSLPEVGGPHAYYCAVGDDIQLAQHIIHNEQQPISREKRKAMYAEHCMQFDSEPLAQQLMQIYRTKR